MMRLHERIKLKDIPDELDGRFEFLKDVDLLDVRRMDEVHATKDADDDYIFLLWLNNNDTGKVTELIRNVLHKSDGWKSEIMDAGEFLVIRTWVFGSRYGGSGSGGCKILK